MTLYIIHQILHNENGLSLIRRIATYESLETAQKAVSNYERNCMNVMIEIF